VYLEANGSFTVYRYEELKQGLSIIPPWQEDYFEKQSWVKGAYACRSCGFVAYGEEPPALPCAHCGSKEWSSAVFV
jgi:rubrerythrin